MVCIPCFIVPVLLFIWHKFIQPILLRYWNPWGTETKNTGIHCYNGVCKFGEKNKVIENKISSKDVDNKCGIEPKTSNKED